VPRRERSAATRIALAGPMPAVRFEIGKSFSALMSVSQPGHYTLCALPIEPVTIPPQPTAQEFSI